MIKYLVHLESGKAHAVGPTCAALWERAKKTPGGLYPLDDSESMDARMLKDMHAVSITHHDADSALRTLDGWTLMNVIPVVGEGGAQACVRCPGVPAEVTLNREPLCGKCFNQFTMWCRGMNRLAGDLGRMS